MLTGQTKSTSHTGNLVLPRNDNRRMFFILQVSGNSTIEFGNGGGKTPLNAGDHYIPPIIPTDVISIESSTGAYILHTSGDDL